MGKQKMQKSYRILNLQGAWFKWNEKNKEFKFNTQESREYVDKNDKTVEIKPSKNKLFSATMPHSLETIRAFRLYKDEVLNEKLETANEEDIKGRKNELFTKLFVNFKFSKDLFEENIEDSDKKKINKKRLRKMIYENTVIIDNIEYRFFKRGASKARNANVIFCKKDCYEKLLKPCLLGLKFEENEKYDMTSKEAYTSLIMSGIIDIINIKRDEILIINDLYSPSFPVKQSVTIMDENGDIKQKEQENMIKNNMTDGQALMDESKFIENEFLNENTTALLRNDFLKCNAVRTKLQEYYKENKIIQVWDMFNGWTDASKIKLVINPSACKYLKFKDQFESEKECYNNWLSLIPEEFGVVKTDHVGNYGYSNRLSYQLLNSLNLNKDELEVLIKDELDYLKYLKDNTLIDSQELKKLNANDKKEERNKRNKMEYFLDYININTNNTDGNDMLADLLHWNKDFRYTEKFKQWKQQQVKNYLENLEIGKIRVQDSFFAIMVSCPWEMLTATHSENNKIDSCIMTGWEIYNPYFDEGEVLMGSRYPNINEGSILSLTNKYHEEFKWFGYQEKDDNNKMKHKHDFVVFVNTWDCDLMDRSAGCDFDVDSIYISNNAILRDKAIESQEYLTPVNGIEGDKQTLKNNAKALAELDNYLGGSTMSIGKIVNKSAIFNAYMYHAINNKKSKEYIKACYDASCTLSSCSQIAIDLAKKSFLDNDGKQISLTKIMNNLNKISYGKIPCVKYKENKILKYDYDGLRVVNEEELNRKTMKIIKIFKDVDIKYDRYLNSECGYEVPIYYTKKYLIQDLKMIVPYFFTKIAKDNTSRIPTYMDCTMDYLQDILKDFKIKAMGTDKKDVSDFLIKQKDLNGGDWNRNKLDYIREVIDRCNSILNQNYYCVNDNKEEKKKKVNIRKWAKQEAVQKIIDAELNPKTIFRIILRAFDLDEKYKGRILYKYRLDKEGNKTDEIIKYEKEGIIHKCKIEEFKKMTKLVLDLLYKAYEKEFLKMFKKGKSDNIELKKYWK
ncbi:UNVERIFIED_ORG: hypothetical protein B2H93_14770 [Clostridium botulinum]